MNATIETLNQQLQSMEQTRMKMSTEPNAMLASRDNSTQQLELQNQKLQKELRAQEEQKLNIKSLLSSREAEIQMLRKELERASNFASKIPVGKESIGVDNEELSQLLSENDNLKRRVQQLQSQQRISLASEGAEAKAKQYEQELFEARRKIDALTVESVK